MSHRELLETTCRLANMLKSHGIQKGDRVAVYMSMSPLAVAALLACARIGAVHTVVFAGFSSEALAGRIQDGKSRFRMLQSGRFSSLLTLLELLLDLEPKQPFHLRNTSLLVGSPEEHLLVGSSLGCFGNIHCLQMQTWCFHGYWSAGKLNGRIAVLPAPAKPVHSPLCSSMTSPCTCPSTRHLWIRCLKNYNVLSPGCEFLILQELLRV